jgi:thiol-disulfide isomerase/thioredoxin
VGIRERDGRDAPELGLPPPGEHARLGIETGGEAKAFPLSSIEAQGGVVNDEVAEVPVVLAASGPFAVSAYERTVDGKAVTFVRARTARPDDGPRDGQRLVGGGPGRHGSAPGPKPAAARRLPRRVARLVAYNPSAALFGPQALERDTPGQVGLPPLVLQRSTARPRPSACRRRQPPRGVGAWCPPCREELPHLAALAREYGDRGVSAQGMAVLIPEQPEVDAVRRIGERGGDRLSRSSWWNEDSYGQLESLARRPGPGPGLVLPTSVRGRQAAARILWEPRLSAEAAQLRCGRPSSSGSPLHRAAEPTPRPAGVVARGASAC